MVQCRCTVGYFCASVLVEPMLSVTHHHASPLQVDWEATSARITERKEDVP